ncbi:TPA: hypothetical protein QCY29_005231 [Bacillus toyonensis]|nr:hypothetical protein [Bacillus toyonensis]
MATIDKSSFSALAIKIPLDSSAKVDKIRVEVVSENVETEKAVYITDIMLQGGTVATSHYGHVSEIKWSFENA